MKEGFVIRKREIYPLLREWRGKMCEFIDEQLRKRYIRLSKLLQTAPVFLWEIRIVRREWFRIIGI